MFRICNTEEKGRSTHTRVSTCWTTVVDLRTAVAACRMSWECAYCALPLILLQLLSNKT
jgi:hypothetical protein